jgi:hypothetical protein
MRKVSSLAVLALSVALGGCLLDATIDAKGGGEMTVAYKVPKTGKLDDVKKQMEGPNSKVTSADLNDQGIATIKLKFDDVTKLSTAKFFKNATTTVTEDKAKGTKTIATRIVNKTPAKLPDKVLEFYGNQWELTVTLPGEVVESNATTKDGNKVTWKKTLQEYSSTPEITLTVTYKVPKD